MCTVYRATAQSASAWGITPAEAVACLERLLPTRTLMEDALIETITDHPPELEVKYVTSRRH